MWNLEKRYEQTYFQGMNIDTDVENGPVVTAEEGECGTNWDSSNDMYALPCIKWTASGMWLYSTGSSAVLCDDLEGGKKVRGRLKREGHNWSMLYRRNQNNIAKQLFSN